MKKVTLACLIIDDPLLIPDYGFLNYEELLERMKVHNFFTEVAFIPWNYKRSNPKVIELFVNNPDFYGVCIHGCNHTKNEFGGSDYNKLSILAFNALWRMEQHRNLTGLPYDPIMVFPQGLFSSVAIQALKDQNYFAAFNTHIKATDSEKPPESEYDHPFTTIYHNFPIFLRRYPKDKFLFERDIALGRPIIIVEHHTAFKYGYRQITKLIDWINSQGNIKWTSLLNIAQYYLGRKAELFPLKGSYRQNANVGIQNIRVAIRRLLCEFRDNYVETTPVLHKVYKKLRK